MKIWKIAKYDLIKLIRDRTSLLFIAVLPIVLTFVMGLIYGNTGETDKTPQAAVGIINCDKGIMGSQIIEKMHKDDAIWIKMFSEEDELFDDVKNANVEAGFIIPENFTENAEKGLKPSVTVVKLPASAGFAASKGIMNNAYMKLNYKKTIFKYFESMLAGVELRNKILDEIESDIGKNLKTPIISVKNQVLYEGSKSTVYNGKAQSTIGIMVMFVMFTIILGAGEILDERKINTWGRLNISPTPIGTIYLGKVLGIFLRGWAQVLLLILFGKFVMGISWGNSIFATVVMISVYLVSITGLGLLLSSLVKTNSQLGAYSAVVIVCTSMLGGCYWPIEFVPEYMRKAAMFMPQYWAMEGLKATVAAGMGLDAIVMPIFVLIGMGICFFGLSLLRGRFIKS